jgi:hypothetical protein
MRGPPAVAASWLAVVGGLVVTPAAAQEPPGALLVGGAMAYNLVLHGRDRGNSGRFTGRLLLRLSRLSYVGIAVGSWFVDERLSGCNPDCSFVQAQAQALVHQIYGQFYVTRHRAFIRSGLGYALTLTLRPNLQNILEARQRTRPVWSVGVGWDVTLMPRLYLTPSVDFVKLRGIADGDYELDRGLALGLGITVR